MVERETADTKMGEAALATDGLEQLLSLEEKIHQTMDRLKSLRAENERLRRDPEEQEGCLRALESRLARLEKEREAVRARVQRLLEQVDSLTNLPSEA